MPSLSELMQGIGFGPRDPTALRPQVQDAWGRSPSDPNYGRPPGAPEQGPPPGMSPEAWAQGEAYLDRINPGRRSPQGMATDRGWRANQEYWRGQAQAGLGGVSGPTYVNPNDPGGPMGGLRGGGLTSLAQVAKGFGGLGLGAAQLINQRFGAAGPSYSNPTDPGGPMGGLRGGMVMLRAPTGETQAVPADQVQYFLARGAQQV